MAFPYANPYQPYQPIYQPQSGILWVSGEQEAQM